MTLDLVQVCLFLAFAVIQGEGFMGIPANKLMTWLHSCVETLWAREPRNHFLWIVAMELLKALPLALPRRQAGARKSGTRGHEQGVARPVIRAIMAA